MQRRPASRPRRGGFELRRDAAAAGPRGRTVATSCTPTGSPSACPVERQRDRRLTGHVERQGEDAERRRAHEGAQRLLGRRMDEPDRRRRRAWVGVSSRSKPLSHHVASRRPKPCTDSMVASSSVRAGRAAAVDQRPGERLDVVGARARGRPSASTPRARAPCCWRRYRRSASRARARRARRGAPPRRGARVRRARARHGRPRRRTRDRSATPRGAPRSTPMRSGRVGLRDGSSRTVAPAAARCTDRPGIAPAVDVEERGGVAHAAGDDELDREAAPALAERRAERAAAARRLEADEAAHGRRDCGSSRRRRSRAPTGTMPAATAAAAPPLEPPALCSRFQGLRVGAERLGLGRRQERQLGRVGAAERDEAGGLKRRGEVARRPARASRRRSGTACRRSTARPASAPPMSFIRNGTPRKAALGQVGAQRRRRAPRSSAGWITAFSVGFSRSRRAIAASTSSRGETSRRCTSSACAVASRVARSSLMRIGSIAQAPMPPRRRTRRTVSSS